MFGAWKKKKSSQLTWYDVNYAYINYVYIAFISTY